MCECVGAGLIGGDGDVHFVGEVAGFGDFHGGVGDVLVPDEVGGAVVGLLYCSRLVGWELNGGIGAKYPVEVVVVDCSVTVGLQSPLFQEGTW